MEGIHEIKPPWLGFGSALSNCSGGRKGKVVGWFVRGSSGHGAAHLQTQARGGVGGWIPETEPLGLCSGCAVANGGGERCRGGVGCGG